MQEECLFCHEDNCPFGGDLCISCGAHPEGDENGIGYCIDCSACWQCEQQRVVGKDRRLTCEICEEN